MNKYSQYIDHTVLSANATKEDIKKICEEAIKYEFKSVCINPFYIKYAKDILKDSNVLVCTVIGFPLGQNTIDSKANETLNAIKDGADEIDMVINISQLKANDSEYCIKEINAVVNNANNKTVKVIVETCLLSETDKINAFNIVNKSNAHFIKTSTGFSTGGATIEDIKLWDKIRKDSNSKLLIKAAGGVRTSEDLENFINSGANRIGTSKGVALISGIATKNGY